MWNYRVLRRKKTWIDPGEKKEKAEYSYAIHEAYCDKNGYVGAITQDPVEPFGKTIEELRHAWVMMAEAFGQPILDYDNIPELEYDRKADPVGRYWMSDSKNMRAVMRQGGSSVGRGREEAGITMGTV